MNDLFNLMDDTIKYDDIEPFKVEYGDIYEVNGHRIMCGDSTKIDDINKLLMGNNVDLIFTDPPYNVAFNGRSGNFDVILNDNLSREQFDLFIKKIIENIKIINPKSYYIWCNWKFYGVLTENLDFTSCIVWAKNNFGMGTGYRHQHEFCLFNGYIHKNIKNESDLWFFDKDTNYLHPTQKPVGLSVRGIKNSTNKGDVVLDLFGGSGSTLIGAELTNRKAFIMELDFKYVEVILNRFYKEFGKVAVKL